MLLYQICRAILNYFAHFNNRSSDIYRYIRKDERSELYWLVIVLVDRDVRLLWVVLSICDED